MSDEFSDIPAELRENYAAIVAERGVTFESLAASVEASGDKRAAAFLRLQAKPSDAPKERKAAPKQTA